MIYTALTKKAMNLMYEVHKNQRDKGNVPYVFHPWHVAEQMRDEISAAAALLHDVCEDGDVRLADLRQMGFPEAVVKAVDLLTRRPGQTYSAYIEKLEDDPVARQVKIADLIHNQDLSRLSKTDSEKTLKRQQKYAKALTYLKQYKSAE
ncbi:GTP pyrophosphokinase [Pseudoramibacter sp.]|jgi:(p)ppGpp synthase/HD superfamily hydrolase|uniref:GTP pyrophosphokinase n=1 Tax=Pseudoramibacter sp. TaxID=2034862 RepID=UPI0025F84592|nr:GTP pyrophosphokinase [Pseudoramibacter sp.]MCH4072608.1 GTP pyrophosphokinase [Pseudoramibacter sp.]MCH4106379.1 GTP pyrophosphokinase [Pseudoramibacter sp.]